MRKIFSPLWGLLFIPFASRSQTCTTVQLSDFPKTDLPAVLDTFHAMKNKLIKQGSYKYYYGIGIPVNYIRARQLAFYEFALNKDKDDPFSGASILMMLYANGFGVKRNLHLSIRLACANVRGAQAEVEGRLAHLKQLQSGVTHEVFDICDDITSGYMMGFCESVRAELADLKRKAALDSMVRNWSASEREAYVGLRKAATQYFEASAGSEVDLSGTARAAEMIDVQESMEERFKEEIWMANACAFKPRTEQEWKAADARLNLEYTKIMRVKNLKRQSFTGITLEGIRTTQRAWIRYRDAWLRFGAVRCPGTLPLSISTLITEERTQQLKGLADLL